MKVIILNSKSGQQDLVNYGKDLLNNLTENFETIVYEDVQPDFSNVKELFDNDEKLILVNQFRLKEGFSDLTAHLESFKNIKYILSPYSSYAGLDLELLKKLNIHYRNNGGANAKSVSQYAITTMFMLLSKFPVFTQNFEMPDGSILGEEYYNKTAGIIGMGNVGKELLTTLKNLGISTVYYDRKVKDVSAKNVSYQDIFKQDLIFITIATNPETKDLLKDFTELLQAGNYVIDVSAEDDLYDKQSTIELLNSNKIKGYALEIFDPKAFNLTSGKNLITTPHIAWCTVDAEKRTVVNYLERALKILEGKASEIDFIV